MFLLIAMGLLLAEFEGMATSAAKTALPHQRL
jgi:hypothetical protein